MRQRHRGASDDPRRADLLLNRRLRSRPARDAPPRARAAQRTRDLRPPRIRSFLPTPEQTMLVGAFSPCEPTATPGPARRRSHGDISGRKDVIYEDVHAPRRSPPARSTVPAPAAHRPRGRSYVERHRRPGRAGGHALRQWPVRRHRHRLPPDQSARVLPGSQHREDVEGQHRERGRDRHPDRARASGRPGALPRRQHRLRHHAPWRAVEGLHGIERAHARHQRPRDPARDRPRSGELRGLHRGLCVGDAVEGGARGRQQDGGGDRLERAAWAADEPRLQDGDRQRGDAPRLGRTCRRSR